jgi:hypothetical protein
MSRNTDRGTPPRRVLFTPSRQGGEQLVDLNGNYSGVTVPDPDAPLRRRPDVRRWSRTSRDPWNYNRLQREATKRKDKLIGRLSLGGMAVVLGTGFALAFAHYNAVKGAEDHDLYPQRGDDTVAAAPTLGVGSAACEAVVVPGLTIDGLGYEIHDPDPHFEADTLRLNPELRPRHLDVGTGVKLGSQACSLLLESPNAGQYRPVPQMGVPASG